jgi:hypothetical protein
VVALKRFRQEESEAGGERLTLLDQGLSLSGEDASLDGRYLAAAGSDGTISVYIMSIEELMEVARSRLSREFTQEECRTYLSLDNCPEAS